MSAFSDDGKDAGTGFDRARLDDAIIVDEIGIESGGYGIYRLRCRYQPVFVKRAQKLHAFAVEGIVTPYVAGDEVPIELFHGAAAEGDLDFIRQIDVALPLRNHRNLEAEGIDLFLNVAPSGKAVDHLVGRLTLIADELAQADLQPGLVICCLNELAASDSASLTLLSDEIRRLGMRIAIGDFGTGRWTDEQIDVLQPDVVRIDGDWFRQVCRDAVTIRLFDSVVGRLRERCSKVLVAGIDSEMHLGVALRGRADLFQGSHLAPLAHTGTVLVDTLSLREKLGTTAKIIPLYG